jgi:hypothetical protein
MIFEKKAKYKKFQNILLVSPKNNSSFCLNNQSFWGDFFPKKSATIMDILRHYEPGPPETI